MKLVTYRSNKGLRAGVILKDHIVDLQSAAAWSRDTESLPDQIAALLASGASGLEAARRVLAAVEREFESAVAAQIALPLKEELLFAPIPQPSKIICIGLNYRDHAEEANLPIPKYPLIFAKYSNSVNGPYDPIVIPRVSHKIDYEAELGVVIGRRGKYIREQDAMDYVAGYLCFNDVSVRDYQGHTPQFTIGKSFDTHGPMGPWLVTKDEIPDPHALSVELVIGDEVLQSSNTKNLIFPIPTIIAYLSEAMTLEPGDVIATGTPSGVGFVRKPPRYIKPGDVVEVRIEGLGKLANPAIAEA